MKPCPICREEHEPRPLSFDGWGVNSCGMYRSRLATFAPEPHREGVAAILGRLFAVAPEMLDGLKAAALALQEHADEGTLPYIEELIARAEGGGA